MPARQGSPGAAPRSAQVAERAEATRAALIASARHLFVAKGYFDTSTEEIVRDAEVTRGALYHHFADKKALFLAVFVALEDELVEAAGTPGTADPFERLRAGLSGFLDASLTPEVQRVLLVDGPAVLGWQEWRALEASYGLGAIRHLLAEAMNNGTMAPRPVDPLAHILLAAVDEAALFIVNAPDQRAARDEAAATVHAILDGLAAAAAAPRSDP